MKLPPLHALICFEVAGRLMSMKKAADELHVTPGAISQQIAKLEQWLQVRLFVRGARTLALTQQGQTYLRALRPALSQINEATSRLMQTAEQRNITISCTSGFAMQWLLPRLPAFEKISPATDIQIGTTHRKVDLLAEGVDFAIRHGLGRYPGLIAERLIDDPLLPVCSPTLLPADRSQLSASEIAAFPLLHDEHKQDWALWLQAGGADPTAAGLGPVFVDSNGVIEAAIAGLGIALIRPALVQRELADGRLTTPLPVALETPLAYYLVYDQSALFQPVNQRFHRWLTACAAAQGHRYDAGERPA
ncbi:transcriptional regulator GcvA [Affinibrenneria salicis]|uniref:Glycine cleavage system transcriptional activator n=1 Tax=Affinibrenneria salicis TaxID=2590031 RepID=A0A5J5FQH3_9GAMM|nr:transcriptional regulator GcvA [Affinibrenneria salicis]KAA8995232.1 transcriptional regulator GcvA [Affinibrenneria salicis]